MSNPGSGWRTAERSRVLAWALWDSGSVGLSAIVVTFVFSVYLTVNVGEGTPGGSSPASWLGRALAVAGLTIAVLAPVIGVWVEAPRRRRLALTMLTGLAVTFTSLMCLIRDDPRYLWPGLLLLAATAACTDLASVPYNTLLRGLTTPGNAGRISGFGLAAGYAGSVVLSLVVYVGFMSGTGASRGLLGISRHDGLNVRAAMLLTACWFAVLALPLLLTARHVPAADDAAHRSTGLLVGYRRLWSDLAAEWRRDRNLVFFLLASAVFRDGLTGVLTLGPVLGVRVYGISPAEVLVFGVTASVVAACGAVLGGLLDDRVGSKAIIVGSLVAIVTVSLILMTLSGARAFWVCGLALGLFLGPAQASARTLLLRMSRDGKEGVSFGLYTMTGRAVSFLAPWLFSVFVDRFHADRAGLGGLDVVLTAGLLAMLAVRAPRLREPR